MSDAENRAMTESVRVAYEGLHESMGARGAVSSGRVRLRWDDDETAVYLFGSDGIGVHIAIADVRAEGEKKRPARMTWIPDDLLDDLAAVVEHARRERGVRT